MDPETVAEAAGEQTEAIVEAALEQAEAREEAAQEIVEQVTEAARQSEIVRTVEDRLAEFETWRADVEQRLLANQSTAEQLLGRMTETVETLALLQAASTPPAPEPTPEPQPEPNPEPQSTLPENAEDGPRESHAAESKPEPHRPSRPKRRFW